MGTSASYGGRTDKSALLPSWALPDTGGGAISGNDAEDGEDNEVSVTQDTQIELGSDLGGEEETGSANSDTEVGDRNDNDPELSNPENVTVAPAYWQAAKSSMTRFTNKSGSGGIGVGGGAAGYAKPGKAYVRAKGGARGAAASAVAGRATAQRVANFFTTVVTSGLGNALRSIGIGQFVGQDADTVYARILDAIAPESSRFDENLARKAMEDALFDFYATQNLEALENLTEQDVISALEQFVAGYIYRRWLQELEISIEKGAISEAAAVGLERSMKNYVRDAVELELGDVDALAIDWSGREGEEIINTLYEEAYTVIGGGEQ